MDRNNGKYEKLVCQTDHTEWKLINDGKWYAKLLSILEFILKRSDMTQPRSPQVPPSTLTPEFRPDKTPWVFPVYRYLVSTYKKWTGKSPFLLGKSTINGPFSSSQTVSLPEAKYVPNWKSPLKFPIKSSFLPWPFGFWFLLKPKKSRRLEKRFVAVPRIRCF